MFVTLGHRFNLLESEKDSELKAAAHFVDKHAVPHGAELHSCQIGSTKWPNVKFLG